MTVMTETMDHSTARRAMIDSQLRTSGVNEPFVLERMSAVERERFVPGPMHASAYIDRAIALPDGGHIAAPLFYGMLLAQARPRKTDIALVVDGGSGYLVELLRPLVRSIESVTPDEALAGSRKHANPTLLAIDGAVERIPQTLVKRLADDGRVITGLTGERVTRLAVGRKAGGEIALLPLAEIGIPRIAAFDAPKAWSF